MNLVGQSEPSVPPKALGGREREILLQLARRSLVEFFQQTTPALPIGGDPMLQAKRGCFVTLLRCGALRGCVGNVIARSPLCRAVLENARNAAFCDSRFPALLRAELEEITIEISVLTPPVRLRSGSAEDLLSRLRPEVDGVLLEVEGRISTFLPQVWEKIPSPVDFLGCLSRKAGLAADAWRDSAAVISVYQAESFAELGTPTR